MQSLDDRPAIEPGLRKAAMEFLASGRAAEGLRAKAADPLATAQIAALAGISPGDARDQMLAVSAVIELIEDEGMTREQCYFPLGLDKTLGPFAPVPSAA